MQLFDMDTHFAPTDEFAYVPSDLRDLAPRWVSAGDDKVRLVVPGRPEPTRLSGTLLPHARPAGGFEVGPRLADMDALGVERQLLNPEFTQYFYEADARLEAALCRSANTAVGKVLQEHPDRFIGAAVLPTQDMEATVEEAERAREAGFAALFMKTTQGGRNLSDPYFWPLYEFANRHRTPISVHSTTKDLGCVVHTERLKEEWGQQTAFLADYVVSSCALIYDGVFDEFPNLKFCFAEAGATWLAWLWDRVALTYDVIPKSRAKTARHPTEYLASNIYATVDPTEKALGFLCAHYSSQNLMLGTDYPHGDVTGRGHTAEKVQALKATHIDLLLEREDISDQAKEEIAYRNALRFLGG